jgi:hypothetical protein
MPDKTPWVERETCPNEVARASKRASIKDRSVTSDSKQAFDAESISR